jgi:hypothetical protein
LGEFFGRISQLRPSFGRTTPPPVAKPSGLVLRRFPQPRSLMAAVEVVMKDVPPMPQPPPPPPPACRPLPPTPISAAVAPGFVVDNPDLSWMRDVLSEEHACSGARPLLPSDFPHPTVRRYYERDFKVQPTLLSTSSSSSLGTLISSTDYMTR